MQKQYDGYKVVPFSKGRQIVRQINRLGEHKHIIHGLVEVDVTLVRQFIREYEAATGTDISFTAFIVTCLAKAVAANERVHAYRKGGSQLVLFDDVDGAPSARFTSQFKNLIESGYGLVGQEVVTRDRTSQLARLKNL